MVSFKRAALGLKATFWIIAMDAFEHVGLCLFGIRVVLTELQVCFLPRCERENQLLAEWSHIHL